jgi:hypothetical protein
MAPAPPAADVAFQGGAEAKPYRRALGAFNSEIEKITDSRFDPEVMRSVVTGESFSRSLDGLDAAAPDGIASAVRSDTEWFRTRWSDVLAYASRNVAYEEQLCSG